MRGFLWGTLALVVLKVVIEPSVSGKVGTASTIFVGALRRLSDPHFGGVPNAAKGARPSLANQSPASPATPRVTLPGPSGRNIAIF